MYRLFMFSSSGWCSREYSNEVAAIWAAAEVYGEFARVVLVGPCGLVLEW